MKLVSEYAATVSMHREDVSLLCLTIPQSCLNNLKELRSSGSSVTDRTSAFYAPVGEILKCDA